MPIPYNHVSIHGSMQQYNLTVDCPDLAGAWVCLLRPAAAPLPPRIARVGSSSGPVRPRAAPIGAPFRALEIRVVALPAVHRTAAQRDEKLSYFRGERLGGGRYR